MHGRKRKNFKLPLGLPPHIGFRIWGQINEIRRSLIKYKAAELVRGLCVLSLPKYLLRDFWSNGSAGLQPPHSLSVDVGALRRHDPPITPSWHKPNPPLPVTGTQTRSQIATSYPTGLCWSSLHQVSVPDCPTSALICTSAQPPLCTLLPALPPPSPLTPLVLERWKIK